MRVLRAVAGVVVFAVVGLILVESNPAVLARALPINSDRENFIVVAHRGASVCAPQNTMAAFRKGIELGANGVELDAQFTRDDVPVVAHTTTVVAGDLTYDDVAEIDVGAGEPVPLLSEALAYFRAHVESGRLDRIYIHDKRENDYSGENAGRILIFADLIRQAELVEHAVVMVESGDVSLWQELAPDIEVLQNWSGRPFQSNRFPIEEADALGLRHFGVYHSPRQYDWGVWRTVARLGLSNLGAIIGFWPGPAVVERYAGEFVVFTLNDPLLMRLYLNAGFDAIGTDDVLLLRQVLESQVTTAGLCEIA